MRPNVFSRMILAALLLSLLMACSGTEITQEEVDESFQGKPVSDILVIVVAKDEEVRRFFEGMYVAQLASIGVEAVSSADAIAVPADFMMKKEDILEAVAQYENDSVIITRLVGLEEKDIHTRGRTAPSGYYQHYGSVYSYVRDPGYSSSKVTIRLETSLYDVKTEKLMWSGQSKTWNKDSERQIIEDVVKRVVADLQKNKLIVPKS